MQITIELKVKLTRCSFDALPEADKELLMAAHDILENAYAPYSAFKVGAAIRLDNNTIITGSNQENSAYPSGLCAERVALFAAKSMNPKRNVAALAVTTQQVVNDPVAPCGACRQVLSEYESQQNASIRILFGNIAGDIWISESVENILPLPFVLPVK